VTLEEQAMRRREFIKLLGGAAAAWPLSARGQAPIIGFLGASTASAGNKWATAFGQRLRELSWIEDRTIAIEYRDIYGCLKLMILQGAADSAQALGGDASSPSTR
jgi:hypothetical protein